MTKALNHLTSGQVKAIVVADFDRLCRTDNYRELAFLQDILETNTNIYTSEAKIDMNTQQGFLNAGLAALMAGNDLRNIKKRMLAAKEIKIVEMANIQVTIEIYLWELDMTEKQINIFIWMIKFSSLIKSLNFFMIMEYKTFANLKEWLALITEQLQIFYVMKYILDIEHIHLNAVM